MVNHRDEAADVPQDDDLTPEEVEAIRKAVHQPRGKVVLDEEVN